MKQLDAIAGEFQCIKGAALAGLQRGLDLARAYPQPASFEIEAIEFAGRLEQRGVAPRRHIVHNGAGRGLDIGRHLALGREKARESLGEIGAASVDANRHGGFPGGVFHANALLLNGAATNRRQPFA